MPPIVSIHDQDEQKEEEEKQQPVALHRKLQRTFPAALRIHCDTLTNGDCEEENNHNNLSASLSDEMLIEASSNKIVGGHLMISKRNSTPEEQQFHQLHYGGGKSPHHSLNQNIMPQMYNDNMLTSVNSSPDHTSNNNLGNGLDSNGFPVGLMVSLHKKLDRSQSEPVWQQEQIQPEAKTNSSRYKTELCRPYEENGFCKYGNKCQFAHGEAELRTLNRHPKYKTELCRTFHTIGICPYGPRCHFIHNAEESRVLSPAMASNSTMNSMGMGCSPPPALISPNHMSLSVSQSLGMSPIYEKQQYSPALSLHSSPNSPNLLLDQDASFSALLNSNRLMESLAETLTNSLQLNSKQLNNHIINNNKTQFVDMIRDGTLLSSSTFDTPPASPPDSSSISPTSFSSSGGSNSPRDDSPSLLPPIRLPIFQSLNQVQ